MKVSNILMICLTQILWVFNLNAQEQIYIHNFGNALVMNHPYEVAPTVLNQHFENNTSWTNSRGSFVSSTNSSAGRALGLADGSGNQSYSLFLTVDEGWELDLTSISLWHRRGLLGPTSFILSVIVDSETYVIFGNSTGTSGVTSSTSNINLPNISGLIEIRIDLFGGSTSASSSWYSIDNFTLSGFFYSVNSASVTIDAVSPSVNSQSMPQNSNDFLVNAFQLNASNDQVVFSEKLLFLNDAKDASFFENFKIWYSTDDSFNANNDELLQTISYEGDGLCYFNNINKNLIQGDNYFFITASGTCESVVDETFRFEEITPDFFIFIGNSQLTGSAPISPQITIVSSNPQNVSNVSENQVNPETYLISWDEADNCVDEYIVVVDLEPIDGIPSGIYNSASSSFTDTNNPNFPSGGKVLYNGNLNQATITDLTENVLYYVKIFTRNESLWSSGIQVLIGGVIWNGSQWSNIVGPTANDNTIIDGDLTLDETLTVNKLVLRNGILTLNNQTLEVYGNIERENGNIDGKFGTLSLNGDSQVLESNVLSTGIIENIIIQGSGQKSINSITNLTGVLFVNSGEFQTNNQLVFKSSQERTAFLAPVQGNIIGRVTTERFIPGRRAFRFLSSSLNSTSINSNWQENQSNPTTNPSDFLNSNIGFGTHITGSGGSAQGFDTSPTNNPSMFTYQTFSQTWMPITNTNSTNLNAGDAFRILIRGSRAVNVTSNTNGGNPPDDTVLRTNGFLHTGNFIINENVNSSISGTKYLQMGNPYQAPIDLTQVLSPAQSNNLNHNFVYYFDPNLNTQGAYVTLDLNTNRPNIDSRFDKYLQPGQSVFVEVGEFPFIQITEANKVVTNEALNQSVFRNNMNNAFVEVTLYNSNEYSLQNAPYDGTRIFFDDEVVNSGSAKLQNPDEDLASVLDGQLASLQTRNYPSNGEEIQLHISKYRHQNYILKVKHNFLNAQNVLLLDQYLNQYFVLNEQEGLYNFEINPNEPASMDENRFKIIFQDQLLNTESPNLIDNISVFPNPVVDHFNLKLPNFQNGSLKIINLLGQEMYRIEELPQENFIRIDNIEFLNSGVYHVIMVLDDLIYNRQIVIE